MTAMPRSPSRASSLCRRESAVVILIMSRARGPVVGAPCITRTGPAKGSVAGNLRLTLRPLPTGNLTDEHPRAHTRAAGGGHPRELEHLGEVRRGVAALRVVVLR